MSKQNLQTIAISVALSVAASVVVNLALERQRKPGLADVVRAKKVELIDAEDHVRGSFELASDGHNTVSPILTMRDSDGRDSISMGIDGKGKGVISFASEHWNEGAVILGHLDLVDPEIQDPQMKDVDKLGAWGLQIRSPQGRYTGIGFFNSDKPIAPIAGDTKR
ncbi:MAG TPA: hypothetical protein VNU92_06250 [Edaphobacter sp.]|jgi:hypothetical protein|nr:hypothetical protein [Edaphobacter sp.]